MNFLSVYDGVPRSQGDLFQQLEAALRDLSASNQFASEAHLVSMQYQEQARHCEEIRQNLEQDLEYAKVSEIT